MDNRDRDKVSRGEGQPDTGDVNRDVASRRRYEDIESGGFGDSENPESNPDEAMKGKEREH
jgi:hypothetical protein